MADKDDRATDKASAPQMSPKAVPRELLESELKLRNAELAAMRASTSWRLTAPLRAFAAALGFARSNSAPAVPPNPQPKAEERNIGEKAAIEKSERQEARETRSASAQRQRSAIEAVAREFDGLCALEPELLVSIAPSAVRNLNTIAGFPKGPELDGWRKLFQSLEHEYQRMIFIPSLDFHRLDIARNAVRAAQERFGAASTLVVATDATSAADRNALPPGTHFRSLSEFNPQLSPGERCEIVITLIYHLQPAAVLNIESVALWDAIFYCGVPLSRVTKLFTWLFPREYAADGRSIGTTDRFFRSSLPHLTKTYADNTALHDELIRDFGLPKGLREKLAVLHQPAEIERKDASRAAWQTYLQSFLEKPSFLE